MFAPKVAKAQTKASTPPANGLGHRRSMPANPTARGAIPGVSRDFSKIPIFPPDRHVSTTASVDQTRTAPIGTQTAPEGPTQGPDGVVTETQGGDAGVPAPVPTLAPQPSGCTITGSFSTIPSGTLTATMTGNKLGTTFDMVGDFAPSIPCVTCPSGEYRQHVRGRFTANGADVTHSLGPGVTLDPSTFQLDGNSTTANYFGRRNYRTTYSHFEPVQDSGCHFVGQDIPGISAGSGTALTVNLEFLGSLIDTKSGSPLAAASWKVAGSGTVP